MWGLDANWALATGLVLTSFLSALLGVTVLWIFPSGRARNAASPFIEKDSAQAVFLFDGEQLLDASGQARAILASNASRSAPWSRLMAFLSPHFPEVDKSLMTLASSGTLVMTSDSVAEDPLGLRAELIGGLTRISLFDPLDGEGRQPDGDFLSSLASKDELAQLRAILDHAPMPVWRVNRAGEVIWANPAYIAAAARHLGEGQELTWPLPRLFDLDLRGANPRTKTPAQASGRLSLTVQGAETGSRPDWFDVTAIDEPAGRLCYAQPVDTLVQVEASLKDFMQTLTKTFAQLHVGLAIFDASRQLQLFNPALLDLTDLPIDFLSARPSLMAVLDAMRDRNMIPEPKDYRSWRRQVLQMEKAASAGLYEETWNLPAGQTYRVIGRPHPNGALALMLEDISGEMQRSRRYRAQLELGQAVLDGIDDAIVAFSASGQRILANAAYLQLWGADSGEALVESGIGSELALWRKGSEAGPIWLLVEAALERDADRHPLTGSLKMRDGRALQLDLSRLPEGETVLRFSRAKGTFAAEEAEPGIAGQRKDLLFVPPAEPMATDHLAQSVGQVPLQPKPPMTLEEALVRAREQAVSLAALTGGTGRRSGKKAAGSGDPSGPNSENQRRPLRA